MTAAPSPAGAVSGVLSRLDAELRAMWAAPPAPGEPAKARACTMNLVVVAATPELARSWVPIVDGVLAGTPARAIVLGLDAEGDDGLEGDATAVCFPVPGSAGASAVCSERVTLVCRGTVCERVASCVDALVATDVPTTLVWLGRAHAFAPLARDASRIVLDSTQGSLSSLAQVARAVRARPRDEQPGVADLAWTRLAPWQELCARAFDEVRLRPLAERVTQVSLTQAGATGAPLAPEGALLLGWLATRLGWRAGAFAGKLRLLRPDGAHVHAELYAAPAARVRAGTLLAAKLEAAGEADVGVTCEVESTPDGEAATWRLAIRCSGDVLRIEQRVALRASDPGRLLERTLHRPTRDDALLEAVAWAEELRGEELSCSSIPS